MSIISDNSVKLLAVGDIMLGDSPKMLGIGVRSLLDLNGADSVFEDVKDILCADIVFGNIECVLSDYGYDKKSLAQAQLRGAPAMAHALSVAGFNIVNVANNHTMQYGPKCFIDTCESLEKYHISIVGLKGNDKWWSKPVIREFGGYSVGFLGYSDPDKYGFEPLYALNIHDHILQDVTRLRPVVDVLVVSLHWGDEFVWTPSLSCRRFARSLVDLGVNILLGHHSHVPQNIEKYGSGWLCYSLGNFVSDMVWNPITRNGLIAVFTIDTNHVGLESIYSTHVNDSFAPAPVKITPEQLLLMVKADEELGNSDVAYMHLVKSRYKINRNLSHIYVLRNFFRYKPKMFLQIILKSAYSLIESIMSRLVA